VNLFVRYWKFNLIGAMGAAVQLTTLAILNRVVPGHYLYATAIAIEITLLHNFAWHIRYTWRERRDNSRRLTQLMRFHLSNGLVSIFGNLALMHLFVHQMHLPVVAANAVAILCCSIINFCLGNIWAFALPP